MAEEQTEVTSADNWLGPKRPVSPAPSGISMKSDWSKGELLDFNSGEPDWLGPKRPVSPAPSGVSMKSDWSKGELLDFNSGEPDWLGPKRPVSPAPSGVSMKSDWSKGELLDFNSGEPDWLGPKRPVSPAPSGISMKSDWSKGELLDFNSGEPDWLGPKRSVSPAPSGVSMRSDWSKGELLDFNSGEPDWLGPKRPVSPAPSGVSMKSDWSKGELLDFNSGEPDWLGPKRPVSPAPSGVSMKSDWSKGELLDFNSGEPDWLGPKRPVSPAPSGVSMKSDWSKGELLDLNSGEPDLHQSQGQGSMVPSRASKKTDHLKDEHSLTKARLSTKDKSSSVPQDDPRDLSPERSPLEPEGPVSPASSSVPQDDSPDLMAEQSPHQSQGAGSTVPSRALNKTDPLKDEHSLTKDKGFKLELTADLKGTIIAKYEKELRKDENDTELYEIEGKNKDEIQTYDALFQNSEKEKTRTVLMTGVAGVGKTFQAKRFMTDWANEKSNKNIDLIVKLDFSELNSRRNEVQSMKDLLSCYLNDNKHPEDYKYDDCKVLFVLDGLEKCELPLDFKNTKKLTDIEERASMDKLLVNLIEGNLLPSAVLWIISQPSGVEKIPRDYIQKVTECRARLSTKDKSSSVPRDDVRDLSPDRSPLEPKGPVSPASSSVPQDDSPDLMAEQSPHQSQGAGSMVPSRASKKTDHLKDEHSLTKDKGFKLEPTADLKGTIIAKYEEELRKDENDTELYEIEGKNKDEIQTYDALFQNSEKEKTRTVLMKGVAGVGKTFQAKRFMLDWAKEKSNKNIDLIVSFDFSELNSRRNEVQSMKDLLCRYLNDNKHPEDYKYDDCKVLFVLDGLEKCELPLDFKNTKKLTDIGKRTSMDKLLVNLIEGNLLPSAVLWIISQPSGVEKIPRDYIHKVTECRACLSTKDKSSSVPQDDVRDLMAEQSPHQSQGAGSMVPSRASKKTDHLKDEHSLTKDKDFKLEPTADLKRTIINQYEEELKKNENDTELYGTEGNNKDKIQTYDALFQNSRTKKTRTVLMKGVAGVGKTFQTKRFMVDWAKEKSNKNIDLIVKLDFSELNSRRDEVQSMKDLLCRYLNDNKHPEDYKCDDCKVLFVLDGLEKCELPLDFKNTKKLTDIEERASMDVLLANLIEGNLLPSAVLWIISQPSGVEKIPRDYIQKVTECRETSKRRQQLISNLKERLSRESSQHEDINHPHQKKTEHIMREDRSSEVSDENKNGPTVAKPVTQVNAVSDIFKDTKGKPIRTVLTIGVADIGKSFNVQKFIKEWAKSDNKSLLTRFANSAMSFWRKAKDYDEEVIFPLNFSKLNLMREEKLSLVGLLNHFFKETEEFVISDFERFKVLFVLDGLDAYQPPLDFDNDKDTLTDVREPASVDVLLKNLIRGNLLPSAQLWITSQPSAANQLPDTCVDRTTEIRHKGFKHELTEDLKRTIINQYEVELRKDENDTELYEIEGNNKDKIQTYESLFQNSEKNKTRTVLMTGVPGVGKTFQAKRFMVDWANEKSNKNINLIVKLDFSELNTRTDKVQSMKDLLRHYLNDNKHPEDYKYDDCKVLFVLDGLEKCELPLDFKNKKKLTDIEQRASMDKLLTNLIKGNLLPSAVLWIISQPSGVENIPHDYIHKVTECRDKDFKHELTADLKVTITNQYEEELRKDQNDTKLYEIEGTKKNEIQTYDALFQNSKNKKTRTVVMKGDAGVGKTFQAKRFMADWANEKSNKNIDLIVSFDFNELNSRRDKVQSMKDLLCHYLNDNKHRRICNYEKCRVAFVLDGLEKCELPLDFEKNKELTNIETPASMDELLTNLIKGNLLRSSVLWIISQPSGVEKIPSKYIQQVTECQDKDFKHELTADLKVTITNQYEEELRKDENDTKLYEIEGTKKNEIQTYDALFQNSKNKKTRTVVMKGDAGVGKTFQAKRFMADWANEKSNKNIDLIVSFDFNELNSRRDKVQSMKDLLCRYLNDNKHRRVCNYEKCRVAFVLDGLEKCELPLDFEKNKELTNIETPASMDELLTNLIKGNLLPSAVLWIISQPSGVEKIPSKYIQQVTECQDKDFKHELTADLKVTITNQYEEELRKDQNDTELYKIEGNNKDKIQTYDALFQNSRTKKTRTVLMTGVPDVGKTFQAKRFMADWANEKSNKNIDLIVSFDFNELNSRRDKVQSMKDLLCRYLNDIKHRRVCNYEKCRVAFVLDGLEKCELPLDFEKNKELTNIETPASMDELLTNLIKGNLLRSSVLWIISQPSGVEKIPSKYIQKVTECRETSKRRQQLMSTLRKRFLRENSQCEDINHPHQTDIEHIMREDRSSEVSDENKNGPTAAKPVTQVKAVSDIFKDTKGKPIRTVLTIGVADIGKSLNVQKFIKEWAKNDKSLLNWLTDSAMALWRRAKDDEEVIFPLNFSELNLMKEKKVSLVGLLNHFFKETKEFVISDFERFKVLFVLDGLDAYQPPLDFDNDKDTLTDVREPASVDVLLKNLIRRNLLPSAWLWITSRPSAAKKLPDTCVDRTTEIRRKPDVASQQNLKTQLQEQFAYVSEGIDKQKASALLNDIYTDLYIIEGERGEVNDQHEARQIQDAKFKPLTQETSIKYHDIFKPASGENKPIRTVLTIGVAGIGKSFTTMKYMLDWAEGAANEDIFYMFPISFRELNLIKGKEQSLEELINIFFPDMETSEITDYDKYRILIVLDGFDECRLDLDFKESNHCTDVTKQTSVEVLLTNLIKGNLLSKAQIWITSRPAASNHIPSGAVDRVTEVRGFNDDQKEEYFRKRFRFSDKDLAEKILSHVKQSRSLFIMCHIPVFCWITSTVLEDLVSGEKEMMMPKTLTDMYIHFLLLQCRQANVKYGEDETGESTETDSCWNSRNQETVISLGKLAFKGLEEANLLFTEENLTECGVDITNTAVFSGLFTQIKREGPGVSLQKLFCFVHLSIQEFLAALYVFYTFINKGENLLNKSASTAADLYKTAVDKALDSQNGDWDLFLRFLLGLSLDTNQSLLQELLKKTEKKKETNKATIDYIKEKIRDEKSDADKNINLFHCLNELNDQSLVREVKKYLHSETVTFENFSASQWSALTFVLLTSDENLDVFDLKKYLKSEEVLLGMLPVVKVSKTALLSWCELSEKSCKGLSSSVLSSASSNLAKLDLSHNDLLDSGVEKLAEGLKSLHCKLEILKLSGCQVTEKGCSFLASALDSKTASSLKQLDLSYNHPGANGQRMLSDVVRDRNMSLELCFDHGGEHRLKPGLKKYGADLKLDENTASRRLVLSDGYRKAKTFQRVEERAKRPKNEDRFKRSQVICEEGQRGLCYWEVEWKGDGVGIAVTYRGVGRRWDRTGGLGCNEKSWSLLCSKTGYTAIHGKVSKSIKVDPCQKIGVFLDWEGGTLTYYSITSGKLSPIHTFKAKFTEPVFPGFWFKKGSATLCEID